MVWEQKPENCGKLRRRSSTVDNAALEPKKDLDGEAMGGRQQLYYGLAISRYWMFKYARKLHTTGF